VILSELLLRNEGSGRAARLRLSAVGEGAQESRVWLASLFAV